MGGSRGTPTRPASAWSALALAAVAVVVPVVAVTSFSLAAPYVGFLDLARTALPGLAYAAGAVVLAFLGRSHLGSPLLAAAACCASAPALAVGLQQRSSAWVAVGALGTAMLAPALVALVLVFPDGRLRRHRWAVALTTAMGLIWALTLMTTFDPSTWEWCRCVVNPIAAGVKPETYVKLVDVGTISRMVVLVVGLAALLVPRRHGGGLPLAFVATYAVLAAAWLTSDALELAGIVRGAALADVVRDLALVALPVLYVLGFVAQRPSRAHVADLLLAARDEQEPNRLRDLVARAIGDPRTTVGWWDARTEGYLDYRGREVAVPDGGALEVEAGGRPIAVVLSDHLAEVDPGVRESVAEALLLAAENRRLTAELQVSLEQVRDSRSRILSASDDTRRQIERDLHDGAQQLMISTGIKLNLAVTHAERGETELLGVLEEAASELNRALAELRNLAGGIAPAALVHGSLTNALQEVALRSAVPTTVRVVGAEQPDERLAATVYFVVAECLANVAKHADASAAAVAVRLENPVRVTVTDNGRGGATLESAGTGLRGLSDRVEARGGQFDVSSGDDGTTVTATIPLGALQGPPR